MQPIPENREDFSLIRIFRAYLPCVRINIAAGTPVVHFGAVRVGRVITLHWSAVLACVARRIMFSR